jgi:thioredoxin 1
MIASLKYMPAVLAALAAWGVFHDAAASPPSPGVSTARNASAAVSAKKQAPDKTILFFMNPNGMPCRMQNEVIEGMADSLASLATVTYVKTTEPADRGKFQVYGIYGLPSLIIADKNGKEIKRLTPGIHDAPSILAALRGKTK